MRQKYGWNSWTTMSVESNITQEKKCSSHASSRKERAKPRKVKALTLTIQSNFLAQIREAQLEALKEENKVVEWLWGLEKQFEIKDDRKLHFMNRIRVIKFCDIRSSILDKAHKTRYIVHPWFYKMYLDLKKRYWWLNLKVEITTYAGKRLTCAKVKAKYQEPSGLL